VDELLVDPGLLVHANPATVIPALHLACSEQAELAAAVYRVSAGRHVRCSPDQRRDVLAIDAARYGASTLLDRLVSSPDMRRTRWRPRWATGGQVNPALHNTLTGHTNAVTAVACTQLDGRPVAVTAGDDETVRVWDLQTRLEVDRLDLPSGARALDVTAAREIVAGFGWDIVLLERTSDGKP
jgi:WD domain, G-beta repeat